MIVFSCSIEIFREYSKSEFSVRSSFETVIKVDHHCGLRIMQQKKKYTFFFSSPLNQSSVLIINIH